MVDLCFKTGRLKVDAVLAETVRQFEAAFPNEVRAYYLDGSYASSYAVQSSDVDLKIVFQKATSDADLKRAEDLLAMLEQQCDIELDMGCGLETDLFRPALVFEGKLIYGEEIREQLTVMPVDFWGRERMYAGCWLICHLFGRSGQAHLPLEFPNSNGLFFGYDDRLAQSGDGQDVRGIKNMMRASGWAATGLIAYLAGKYVTNKAECVRLYRAHIGDEWTSHIEALYETCRNKWAYCVPASLDDRDCLRKICERNLAFENHILNVYRTFLVGELTCGDIERQKEALDYLGRTPFHDADVIVALQALLLIEALRETTNKVLTLVT